jgi:uncharacterized protein involved in exopolysaccharide biosynthesis
MVFSVRGGWVGWLAPVLRHLWAVALFAVLGVLLALAFLRMQPPIFEVSGVVLMQDGAPFEAVAQQVLDRDNLIAMAARHGPSSDVLDLRKAIAINGLMSAAGQATGYAPQRVGIVVSVRWPDAEVAARLANDLAQQILDLGNAGRFDDAQVQLEFYLRDELRLWQEVAALRAEQEREGAEADLLDQRQLMLMQDQYEQVRARLAETETAVRLTQYRQAGQFSLLSRASAASAARVLERSMLMGFGGSLLLAAALVFVVQRRFSAARRGRVAVAGLE